LKDLAGSRFENPGSSRRARVLQRAANVVVLVALTVWACRSGSAGPAIGDLAPDFVLPRLDGKVQKLSNYRGSVVVVNLWATWCPPCIEEMPLLDRLAADYAGRGVVFLGVAGDEDRAAVERFVHEKSPAFVVLLDPGGEVGTQYGITGYPETFVVDREGRLRHKFIGPLPAVAGKAGPGVSQVIEALLGG
jgi:thiol-disulfide isomerase/thioredoxin